uniref:Serpin domain-containing protein n=1 Tax=Eutreptiella gymnastica TaxID=73025 RepID=A0A7S4LET1_9EUGL
MGTVEEVSENLFFPDNEVLLPGMYDTLSVMTSTENYTLSIANRLFVPEDYKLRSSFTATMDKTFLGGYHMVDFANTAKARRTINGWLEGKTRSRIKDVTSCVGPSSPLDSSTRLVLVNALYFKGDWAQRFPAASTKPETFHLLDKREALVQMMHLEGQFRVASIQRLDSQILELPFKGGRLSLIIILPNERYGLKNVENKLPSYDLNQVNTKLMMALKRKTHVHLPRFQIETGHELVQPLQSVGVRAMFSPTNANFSGVSPEAGLYMSTILQKVGLRISEEGADEQQKVQEIMARSASRGPTPPYVCDHPFLFVLKDRLTRMLLVTGRVMEPELA